MTKVYDRSYLLDLKQKAKPKHEESQIQQASVKWFRYQYPQYRMNLFAVGNGGKRGKVEAGIMKGEGVVPGVADMMLAKSNYETGKTNYYHGLFIEFKTAKGKQSPQQKAFEAAVTAQGYQYSIVRSVEEFMSVINNYLK